MQYVHFPFCLLFVFPCKPAGVPGAAPVLGQHPCCGSYWGREVPARGFRPRDPMCQGVWSHVQDLHQARLALWGISLAVPRGPATCRNKVIRQVTARHGRAPGRRRVQSRRRKAAGLRGQHCSASLSAGPWVPGHGGLLLRLVERHGLFQSDLFLALDMLSSGGAKCLSEGQPLLDRRWSLERLPRFPCSLCSARGERWPEELVVTTNTTSRAWHPRGVLTSPLTNTCARPSGRSPMLMHGSTALEEDLAAAQLAFWPDKGVSERLGRCYGLVGGGGGEQLP